MQFQTKAELVKHIDSRGEYHDAVISEIALRPDSGVVEFTLENMLANFRSQGTRDRKITGKLVFRNVKKIIFVGDFEFSKIKIYELIQINSLNEEYISIEIKFSPSGSIRLDFKIFEELIES